MKNTFRLLSLLLASVLIMGCTEESIGTISTLQDQSAIDAEGGKGYFMLNSSHPWSASCNADWITLDNSSGVAGSSKIAFTVEQHWNLNSRSADIIVNNSGNADEKKLTVVQNGFVPYWDIETDATTFSYKGTTSSFTIATNFEYTITCDANWISFGSIDEKSRSAEEGEDEEEEIVYESERIFFSIATSSELEDREAEIVITCNNNSEIKEVIKITQEAFYPDINCTTGGDILNFDATAQNKYVMLTANVPFVATSNVDWISIKFSTTSYIYLNIKENTGAEARTGTVTLYNEEYNYTKTLTVTQLTSAYSSIEMTNGDFENGLTGWSIRTYSNGAKATVEVVDGEGINGSKAVKISQAAANGKCSVAVARNLSGLEKRTMYRLVAQVRYENVASGCGAVLFSPNTDQYWNASKYLTGTNNSYTQVYVDFLSDDSGCASICCALGFWQGGLANGGYSTGTVYYDNVYVMKVTQNELYMREGEHMRIYFNPTKVTARNEDIDKWLSNVDKMYEAYEDLVGAVPQGGRQFAILSTPGMYSGYWALAGYPILIKESAVTDVMTEISNYGTMSFGLMHEIGHVFNLDYTNWNWNDEMFANFRMQYALETTGNGVHQKGNGDSAKKVYMGREILNMYKQDYDMTLPTGKLNDNAIHYLLARLADENIIGWEPFKLTFREIRSVSCPYSNKYDKFKYFLDMLSKHASTVHGKQYDLFNDRTLFTADDIAAIKAQLN